MPGAVTLVGVVSAVANGRGRGAKAASHVGSRGTRAGHGKHNLTAGCEAGCAKGGSHRQQGISWPSVRGGWRSCVPRYVFECKGGHCWALAQVARRREVVLRGGLRGDGGDSQGRVGAAGVGPAADEIHAGAADAMRVSVSCASHRPWGYQAAAAEWSSVLGANSTHRFGVWGRRVGESHGWPESTVGACRTHGGHCNCVLRLPCDC